MGFQRLNTRAAKVNGEMVMEIRRRYAAMESYPMIREALISQWGVALSIQQITRIAKGHSWAQLPTLETDREVGLEMRRVELGMQQMPNARVIEESLAKVQQALAMDQPQSTTRVMSLEEIEQHERAVMGVREGVGLEKLASVVLPKAKAVSKINAENLLEELRDENQPQSNA